jgi:hypothetical protein
MRLKLLVLVPAVLILHLNSASATICGSAYFSHDVNWWWSSDLYFSVAGAPANTCGDLWGWRNGSGYQLEAAGWICTNSLGQATKGPWSFSSQSDDETAFAFIDWGTCTSNEAKHIWDVNGPTVDITSSVPGTFSGTASDDSWGAGFDADWAVCYGLYYDATLGKWWDPNTGSYSSSSSIYVPCSFSGMPSLNVTWSASNKPTSHTGGHSYYWEVWVNDGGNWAYDSVSF